MKEGAKQMPKCGKGPWAPRSNYIRDSWMANRVDLREGLKLEKVSV